MDKESEDSGKLEENGLDQGSETESQDEDTLKVMFEKEDLARQLEAIKKRLGDAHKENQILKERYYAASEVLIATKEELAIAQKSIIEEQERNKKYEEHVEEIKTQIHKSGNKAAIKVLEKILQKEAKQNGFIDGKPRSSSGEDDLMLSCTLCSEKIRVSELASHSRICSAQDGHAKPKLTKQPSTPSGSPDMLRVNVTYSETDEKNETFKVVTKTTLPNYEFPLYEVHRSEAHFEWLQAAMQDSLPERIVPPLVKQTSLNGKIKEFQRFLSRICAHKDLKNDGWLHLFLTGFNEELDEAKTQLDRRKASTDGAPQIISDRQGYDPNAPVYKCKRYFESLHTNLQGLIDQLQTTMEEKIPEVQRSEGLGVWFKAIADGEPTETYLKTASAALSQIFSELTKKEPEENVIINDLISINEYVKGAQDLLERVEVAVDTFLFWDAEVRACEDRQESPTGSGETLTQRWAKANSNSAQAKETLERTCQDLAFELSHFDLRKEMELREVLIEYSSLRSEHYEKVQSKWFGVKFMVEAQIAADVRAVHCIKDL
ncbi:sorting nexin-30 isoform X4 [Nematostella vectensis]|nr:sorting nexin-30 isoform X4 [Nematostella vectensis]